jgi:hypothetical protein
MGELRTAKDWQSLYQEAQYAGKHFTVEITPAQIKLLLERLDRVETENLNLRGADQVIWYHGTKLENVETIKRDGFKEGTYFARHMEDAVGFGGPFVFTVEIHFESPPLDGWQIVCANAILPSAIKEVRVVKPETDCEELRRLLAKMREPVSSEEWEHIGYWSDSSRPETDITHRKDVDRLIAARASAGEVKDGE